MAEYQSLLVPPLRLDESSRALDKVAADRMDALPLNAALIYDFDRVHESALLVLGEQFNLLGRSGLDLSGFSSASELERRELLKKAIDLHRYKGTRWAIKQVLEILSTPCQIEEWFQYGGRPYCFTVDVDLLQRGVTEDLLSMLTSVIGEYKSARAHLEALRLWLTSRNRLPSFASTTLVGELTTIFPYLTTEIQQSSVVQIGIGCWAVETVPVYPLELSNG